MPKYLVRAKVTYDGVVNRIVEAADASAAALLLEDDTPFNYIGECDEEGCDIIVLDVQPVDGYPALRPEDV